jgi:hypothetical protein
VRQGRVGVAPEVASTVSAGRIAGMAISLLFDLEGECGL